MSLPPTALGLWPEMLFVERGWLSANLTLFVEPEGATVVDTGYCTHAPQTLTLLTSALQGRPLTRILNTHLHSDHCGGNAALQAHWPQVRTWIAPGPASHVHHWDTQALSYTPTGQTCPRFRADALLQPGTRMVLGTREWEVHAAPGHDPDSVVLFEPERRLLISADALWEQGFGVVFPEIEGVQAFDAVAATLELIESLQPAWVLPGHGTMFSDVDRALRTARERLQHFVASPPSHARYAAKVLLKFKLLEWQQRPLTEVQHWCAHTPYLRMLHAQYFAAQTLDAWSEDLAQSLVRSGAAALTTQDGVTLLVNR